jgi:D-3-phosphoglycerate dehydrogenase
MEKILISPSSFGQCGKVPIDLLRQNGYEVIENPYGRKLNEKEILELANGVIGIIAGVENLSCNILKQLKTLKVISRVGVGMDSVDLECATELGIVVKNTPDGPTQAVAELTVGLAMSLLRHICISDKKIKNGIWKKAIGNLINKQTIGIIGLGRIGKQTAKLFLALGAKILGYDIFPDNSWAEKNDVEIVELDEILKRSDIVTLHLPRTNKPLIGKKELQQMSKNTYLINVSRGGVVDEDALYQALNSGELAGAAVDVFVEEPYKGKLRELENIILTPHLGSYACEAKLKMEIDAVNNLLTVLGSEHEKA